MEIDSLFSRSMGGQTAGEAGQRGGSEEGRQSHRACGKSLGPSRRAAKTTLERKRAAEEAKGDEQGVTVSKGLWSNVCHHPRHCWPGSPLSEEGLAQGCSISPPQTPRALFLLAKQPLSLYQMPSPTHTEHRLSPDSANPARSAERTRICIALRSPSFLTSLLGDTLNHPHMGVVLASHTPYLMHTAGDLTHRHGSYMFSPPA